MSFTLNLETYVKTKGYYTDQDLHNIQFEIGERIKEEGGKWDVYVDLLMGKIYEKEGTYDQFHAWCDTKVLDELEEERLNEIVD